MGLVETVTRDGVMTITLADEQRRNPLSNQLVRELVDAINHAEGDDQVRVVVVTNKGPVFCAGADLTERLADDTTVGRLGLDELLLRVRTSPKVFVGRIAGHCVAGGVGLAAVMDISVAVETATFGFSEVRLGLAPAVIAVVCLPKMRLADAKSAFLRATRFSAAEAVRIGLVNSSVAASSLDQEITAIVNDLLAGEPHALAAAKSLTAQVPEMSADEALAWTAELSATLFASDQAKEGMTAFFEKRPASWVTRLPEESA